MKLLSSPYSNSNSPSSSASFDHNVCTSQTATATCLITSILRRILCSHSLPSDHITSTDTDKCTNTNKNTSSHPLVAAAAASPGVVARLMGLDSNSSTPTQQNDHKHQKISSKPSSLLEMPTFFELENDDFFLLTFDTIEANSKRKMRARRRRRRTRKMNENSDVKAQLGHREDKEIDEDSMNLTRTKKKITGPCPLRIVEQEDCNSSQDLSPVSVLDFDQFLFDSPEDCTIRRKLSSRLEDYSPLSTQTDDNSSEDDQNSKVIEEARQRLRDNNYSHTPQHFNRQQGEICRLAEAQVVQFNWKFNDHVEDIYADFGLKILDHLLEELVDQLYSR